MILHASPIQAGNQVKDRNGREVAFLNSMKDYKHKDKFTVVIIADTLAKFTDKKIEEPVKHFMGKTVHVAGSIELRRGQPQIILKNPQQIEIRKEGEAKKPA